MREEFARQEILSNYNLTSYLTIVDSYEMKGGLNDGIFRFAPDGSLFGKIPLLR